MKFTKKFQELSKKDADIAGGKGASLGEMTQAGIPVPPGFVVLSESFEQFLKETDLIQEIDAILHKVNHKEIHTVESASQEIRELILNAEMPKDIADEIHISLKELNTKYVAVRSSATAEDGMDHAWAGQLESYLNTTEDQVLTKVKLCWSSLFTPRAIFYRFEKSLHTTKISVAVVVQKMVESDVSGIAFSVHPVTEDRNQLIIEAGFGLGEAIVSGSVTPDSYVVEKEPRNILDINISTQNRALYRSEKVSTEHGNNEWINIPEPKASSQVLTKEQILELSEIILNIERHYGFPCDIEWASEAGKFYIVQSRPITTLSSKVSAEPDALVVNENTKYSSINQDNYDYLWNVGISYLFCSIYHQAHYKDKDFVFTWNNGDHTNFVGKEERKKISKDALRLYTTEYSTFKKLIENHTVSYSKELDTFTAKEIKNLSNLELADSFSSFSSLVVKIFEDYFYLEYFCTDEVARIVEEKDQNYDIDKLQKELEEIGKLKLHLREVWNKIFYPPSVLEKYALEIANRFSLGDKVFQYKFSELIDLLKGETISIPDRTCVVWGKVFDGKEITGAQAEIIMNQLRHIDNSITEFRGNIANKGFYKGKVKKISFSTDTDFPAEISKMDKGDVLVSGSTGPEMILACKKAGAIITDEGGVISHAAIVSRELKIPCIIGTKIATKILNDGDMVEVDANNGVVRIIK